MKILKQLQEEVAELRKTYKLQQHLSESLPDDKQT